MYLPTSSMTHSSCMQCSGGPGHLMASLPAHGPRRAVQSGSAVGFSHCSSWFDTWIVGCIIYVDFFSHYMALCTILIHTVHKIKFFRIVMYETCSKHP